MTKDQKVSKIWKTKTEYDLYIWYLIKSASQSEIYNIYQFYK